MAIYGYSVYITVRVKNGEIMKSFGVGCFHFSINDELDKAITVQEYINEIKDTLEKINSITDIKIKFDEDFKDESFDTTPPNPKLNNGDSCHPFLHPFSIEYKIYIPYRIQAKLIGVEETSLNTYTENFVIYMRHAWHGPLSFVECANPKPETKPSTAVQIIRKYLPNEFINLDTFLIPDYLGPSPFHADFHLKFVNVENIETKKPFMQLLEMQTGYDEIIFTCDSNDYDEENKALQHLFYELEQEISFFYEITSNEVNRMHEWNEISECMHSILEFENAETKKSLIDKIFSRPKLFRKAFKDIGLFKGQDLFISNLQKRNYNSIYESDKHRTYLKVFIDRRMSESGVYPVQESIDLISYFDQKSSKSFELAVVFIAAIIGGVIGSIITVSFN